MGQIWAANRAKLLGLLTGLHLHVPWEQSAHPILLAWISEV